MALVNWSSVCQHKACGGLGIRQQKDQNSSFSFLKLEFNILTNLEALWVLVLRAKYGVQEDCCLKEIITEKGCWNLDLFRVWLPEDLIGRISSIQPPHPLVGLDKILWTGTSSGCFSIKSAYHKVKESSWNSVEEAWKLHWKVEVPQRVRVFLWLVLKQRLLTQAERLRRGVINDARCSVCGHGYEDVLHTIRDCDAAKKLGSTIQFYSQGGRSSSHASKEDFVGTDKWIRTKTNRAIKINTGSALTGGVLRDQNGDWVLGFNRRIGICSIFEVELWGILDSVTLGQGRCHDRILIQSDNMKVIGSIKSPF
ncbi:hypothetical protein Gotur_001529 [Gossypium turneri]